ncbi:MAG: hypothetical protein ACE5LG_07165 [Anaerolineae bacterium]
MVSSLQLALGFLILVTSYTWGPKTGLFHFHIIFPLGVWFLCDGLNFRFTGRSTLHGPKRRILAMILWGALFGLFLDFQMIAVTKILRYLTVTTPLLALGLYIGWGFCLPAIYESYRLASFLTRGCKRAPLPERWRKVLLPASGPAGAILFALPLFAFLYMEASGPLIIPSFAGLWLLLEYGIYRKRSKGLLGSLLEGFWSPLAALTLASITLTLIWEGLGALMGSWRYQNLFWLEPRLLGVPLVAFFGYFCWYVLFLSLHQLVSGEEVWY